MMNRTAKLRLLALIPLLLAALWYPAQKIRSYEFPAVPPQEFRFRVDGVDPYDPFRGRYITLDIKTPELETEDFTFRPYKYAVLRRNKDNFATVTELSEKNTPNRPCLRIRYHGITRKWQGNQRLEKGTHRFIFPFTRYFLNEKNASAADELLRKAIQAELLVLIYPDGNYAVKELIIDGKPLREAIEAKQRAEQN